MARQHRTGDEDRRIQHGALDAALTARGELWCVAFRKEKMNTEVRDDGLAAGKQNVLGPDVTMDDGVAMAARCGRPFPEQGAVPRPTEGL